ncbi:MAG: metallophosphoesterase N-terminal domain-containing protein, partial [Bacteroidales bacterium]
MISAASMLLMLSATSLNARKTPIVSGRVTIDGKPAAGVCVSDGIRIVKTDTDGYYAIGGDKSEGFVFVITPSGTMAPVRDS